MTLKECIKFVSVDERSDIFVYVAYIDETGYDTACYEGEYNQQEMLSRISEEDLNKEVLGIEFSVNHVTKYDVIDINVKNY